MRLLILSLGVLMNVSVEAAEHAGVSAPQPLPRLTKPLKNFDTTPLSKINPLESERVHHQITEFLTKEINEDIDSMKRKRREDVDKRSLQALECLRDNISLYVRGADDSGPELLRDIKSQNITPAQFKSFFRTISNTIRFDHNFDE
jgi:hypothetical protein